MRADLIAFIATLRKNRAARVESLYASDKVYALLDAYDALASQDPVADLKSLGPALRETGLTLRQIEAETGVSKSAISRLIRGKAVTVDNFLALQRWLFASPVVPVAAKGEAEGWMPTHRHLKSGHLVRVLGIGKMQSNHWFETVQGVSLDSVDVKIDMRDVVVYEHGGSLWARPREEFEDGRFEPLPTGKGDGQP